MPLFGDQDAMILLLQNARALDADGEPFDGHGLVVLRPEKWCFI